MKFVLVVLLLGLLGLASSLDLVIHHNKLFLNGTEFFVKGVNYAPAPLGITKMGSDGYGGGGYCSAKLTPFWEWKSACYDSDYFDGGELNFWATWPPASNDGFAALWRRDFPLIKAMGANLLRLYNANPTTKQMSELYPMIPAPTGKNHIPFLDYAKENGFYVMFPLISDMWTFNNYKEEDFKRLLRAQIDEVGGHDAVLIWQFGNEMNWYGGNTVFGFYLFPELMAKYNHYVQYIRQYTLARWGRKIPITHGLIDKPPTYDWLMQEFDNDILSVNVFRGATTTHLFSGNAEYKGMKYGTCAWNKPVMITEWGWNDYSAGRANQLISDFVSHMNDSLVGVVYFEFSDEVQKPSSQRSYGAFSVAASSNGTHDGTTPDLFLVDTRTPKAIRNEIVSGTYQSKPYNYFGDFYALAGRSRQTLANSVDYCDAIPSVTFTDCPGGYPACNGHGTCDRTSGYCTCSAGWVGSACEKPVCNCNNRGTCNILTSPPQCDCEDGFYGPNCESQLQTARTECPNKCTGADLIKNGVCNATTNLCKCVPGWKGLDCGVVTLANPFPGLNVNPNPPRTDIVNVTVCETSREQLVMTLSCPASDMNITSFTFASYGTPSGYCGNFARGNCHAQGSLSLVQNNCLGKTKCSFTIDNPAVGGDPCNSISKSMFVQFVCTAPVRPTPKPTPPPTPKPTPPPTPKPTPKPTPPPTQKPTPPPTQKPTPPPTQPPTPPPTQKPTPPPTQPPTPPPTQKPTPPPTQKPTTGQTTTGQSTTEQSTTEQSTTDASTTVGGTTTDVGTNDTTTAVPETTSATTDAATTQGGSTGTAPSTTSVPSTANATSTGTTDETVSAGSMLSLSFSLFVAALLFVYL